MNRENEKAMFAKKKKDNSLAGLDFNTNIHTVEKEGDTQHMIGGKTANERRELIKQVIKDGLKNGNEVYWNKDKPTQTRMFIDKSYSHYNDPEMSRHINYETHTVTGLGNNKKVIIHNKKTRLNPKFADNPECNFCHKKTTKLYNAKLLDDAKTPIKVCAKCKNKINEMSKLIQNLKTLV